MTLLMLAALDALAAVLAAAISILWMGELSHRFPEISVKLNFPAENHCPPRLN